MKLGSSTSHALRELAATHVKPRLQAATWQKLRNAGYGLTGQQAPERAAKTDDAAASEPVDVPRPMSEWDLPSLASHFGTDKWGVHRYASHYESHFAKYKNDAFTLLEIGIGGYARENLGGASLRMWKAFFPRAQIIGLDIEDKSFVDEPRITTYQGSQVDEPLLRRIVGDANNLRIVVDDGSHRPEHIRQTFNAIFPLLPSGSLYAIEDTQTSYWPRYGGSLDLDDPNSTMGLVKRLVDGLNYEEWQDEDNVATDVDRNITSVHCYHNMVVIEKGANDEGTRRGARERAKP